MSAWIACGKCGAEHVGVLANDWLKRQRFCVVCGNKLIYAPQGPVECAPNAAIVARDVSGTGQLTKAEGR